MLQCVHCKNVHVALSAMHAKSAWQSTCRGMAEWAAARDPPQSRRPRKFRNDNIAILVNSFLNEYTRVGLKSYATNRSVYIDVVSDSNLSSKLLS